MSAEKTSAVGDDAVAETKPPAPPAHASTHQAAEPSAEVQQAAERAAKKAARRSRRKVAKALLYAALAMTALLVLAEPWLLVPVALTVLALSLWN
ncbi:hypothetical protein [Micromonospora avicenniae]|uniref:hypothetical protein n=1 Tax=Micromonospora avicenniae TaxID=1198245 RepID=UPI00331C3C30